MMRCFHYLEPFMAAMEEQHLVCLICEDDFLSTLEQAQGYRQDG
jgi:hypothetical protein